MSSPPSTLSKCLLICLSAFIAILLSSCLAYKPELAANPYPYSPPFEKNKRFLISQAFYGLQTHNNELNRFAVDITMPVGTPVCAARAGVVVDVVDINSTLLRNDKRGKSGANSISIKHSDGTIALYAHLKGKSITVTKEQSIKEGECFSRSGNSGNSTGPHLHFSLLSSAKKQRISIPFNFINIERQLIKPTYLAWLQH